MQNANAPIVVDGAMSADIVSSPIFLDYGFLLSIQAVWTGSPAGVFKLQTSDDIGLDLSGTGVVNWTNYTGSDQTITGAGDFTWRVSDPGDRWIRLVYTRTSGSGTLNARFNLRGT